MPSYGYLANIFPDDVYLSNPGQEGAGDQTFGLGAAQGPTPTKLPTQKVPREYHLDEQRRLLNGVLQEAGSWGVKAKIENGIIHVMQGDERIMSLFRGTYDRYSTFQKRQMWERLIARLAK